MYRYYLLLLIAATPCTILLGGKKKKVQLISPELTTAQAPISRQSCPLCPNFACPTCFGTGIITPSGITGCTGAGCTGPCFASGVFSGGSPVTLDCLTITQGGTIPAVTTTCQQINGNLLVNLNADIKSNLIVEDNISTLGNACISGNVTLSGDATVAGDSFIFGSLSTPSLILNGDFVQNGSQTINGSLFVTGSGTVDGALNVLGSGSFASSLTATGGLAVSGGQVIYGGGLAITNAGCSGSCTGAIIDGNVCFARDEVIMGDFHAMGQLTVDQNSLFNNLIVGGSGPTGANNVFTTNGDAVLNDGLTIAAGDEIINSGSLILTSGNFSMDSAAATAIFKGTVTANNGVIISGGVTVTGNSSVTFGNLEVTSGNATIAGALSVNGPVSSLSSSDFTDLTITSTANSLGPTAAGAALVVDGGAGIAEDLWVGGNQYFALTASGGVGIPSGLNYYEESCYATAFIWGGLTATPTESVLIKIVRIGNIVNLIIPALVIANPGTHIDVITSNVALPARFRPTSTVRGAASTIISNSATTGTMGELGEFNISPAGIITLGIPGQATSPQLIMSTNFVQADINTLTYNLNGCTRNCKRAR